MPIIETEEQLRLALASLTKDEENLLRQRLKATGLATDWPEFREEDPSDKPLKTDKEREYDAYDKWAGILREYDKGVPLPEGRESNALLTGFRIPKIWGEHPGAMQARMLGAEPRMSRNGKHHVGWDGGMERISVKVQRNGIELREIQTVDSRPSDYLPPFTKREVSLKPDYMVRETERYLSDGRCVRGSTLIIGPTREFEPLPTVDLLTGKRYVRFAFAKDSSVREEAEKRDPFTLETVKVRFSPQGYRFRVVARAGAAMAKDPNIGYFSSPKKAPAVPTKIVKGVKVPMTAEEIAARDARKAVRDATPASPDEIAARAAVKAAKEATAKAEGQVLAREMERVKSTRALVRDVAIEAGGVSPKRLREAEERAEAARVVKVGDRPVANGSIKSLLASNDLEVYKAKGPRQKQGANVVPKEAPRTAEKAYSVPASRSSMLAF